MRFKGKKVCALMMAVLMTATAFSFSPLSSKAAGAGVSGVTRQAAETLTDRALVAVALTDQDNAQAGAKSGVYLSWRLFKQDPSGITFDVYRNGAKVKAKLDKTNWTDTQGKAGDEYYVIASSGIGSDTGSPDKVKAWGNQYEELQLIKPADETMPDGSTCTYTANDMSVGDLDGDGQYELVVKWYPSNAKDNSQDGYTGKTFLDAYDFSRNGNIKLMWRIDLGVNIRSGAHYTQFQVFDIDGDGKAEVACKTADGTTAYSYNSVTGNFSENGYVGECSSKALPTDVVSGANDYRNSKGYILSGPEYLTVFNGRTGKIIDTTDYWPARGDVGSWGTAARTDTKGNRCDRFLACTAYLDGVHPSFVFCRGYYGKSTMAAYNLVNGKLHCEWKFSTEDPNDFDTTKYTSTSLQGQGDHNLCVADVDGDGKDEIIYGALCIDDNGKLKYSTGLGHGDAIHVGDLIPSRPGLEVFNIHESTTVKYSFEIHDANTGEIIWGYPQIGRDCGRGLDADIDPTQDGAEFWATRGGVFSSLSTLNNTIELSKSKPSVNFSIYWDGDLLKELFDHTMSGSSDIPNITKWDYEAGTQKTLFESAEVSTNNGTKGNPCLAADIMGDWRDEVILRSSADNSKIRIYTTDIPTNYSIPTLMQDSVYRTDIAWQNTAYNQPADLGYNLTAGLATAKVSVTGGSKNSVSLKWTPASDGKYGHAVTGYCIYRAGPDGNYSLAAKTDLSGRVIGTAGSGGKDASGNYFYTDKNPASDTSYSYKVAAVVDGESSFNSTPVKAST